VIAYHKFDAAGHTQLFNARREADGWRIYQTSDWDTRWEFHGGGTIPFEIRIGPIETTPDGVLTQSARHAKHGAQHWRLDPQTLKPVGRAPRREGLPAEIGRLRSDRPGMGVRTVHDLGASGDPNTRFVLRWETMPVNRDRPHTGEHPPPSMLQVVEVRTKGEGQSLQQ